MTWSTNKHWEGGFPWDGNFVIYEGPAFRTPAWGISESGPQTLWVLGQWWAYTMKNGQEATSTEFDEVADIFVKVLQKNQEPIWRVLDTLKAGNPPILQGEFGEKVLMKYYLSIYEDKNRVDSLVNYITESMKFGLPVIVSLRQRFLSEIAKHHGG